MPSKNPRPRIPNMCPLTRSAARQSYFSSLRGATRRSNPITATSTLWIASRSLSSGAHSRDPLARNDGLFSLPAILPEHFIKQASHRRPCAAVGLLAVERGAQHRTISCRIGETVQRVAVTDDLPVADVSRAHLVLKGFDLFGRCKRIVGAGTDQHAGLHVAGNRRPPGCKDTVEADDSFEIGSVARELKHHRAAEAETDGAYSIRIDLRQRRECRQCGTATGAERLRFVAEVADQLGHLLQIARLPALTEHIGGERHVAKLREHARTRHRKIAQAQSLVKDQHARLPLGCFLIEGEIATQIDRLIAVIDVVRLHRRSPHPPEQWSR